MRTTAGFAILALLIGVILFEATVIGASFASTAHAATFQSCALCG